MRFFWDDITDILERVKAIEASNKRIEVRLGVIQQMEGLERMDINDVLSAVSAMETVQAGMNETVNRVDAEMQEAAQRDTQAVAKIEEILVLLQQAGLPPEVANDIVGKLTSVRQDVEQNASRLSTTGDTLKSNSDALAAELLRNTPSGGEPPVEG